MRCCWALLVAATTLTATSAVAVDSAATPTVSQIVFAADHAEESEVVVADLRSRRTQAVTGTAGAGRASASPDGRFVVFVKAEQTSESAVWIVRRDGRGRHRLAAGYEPTWSPSGRRLAFVTVEQRDVLPQLMAANRDGSGLSALYTGHVRAPRWSPGGQWIAFVLQEGSPASADLYVLRPDGSNPRLLVRGIEPNEHSWSPDGREIVFTREDARHQRDLYRVSIDSGLVTRLTDDPRSKYEPRWSPDGRLIAFSAVTPPGPTEVVVIDPAGASQRVIGEGFRPEWSSDGRLCYLTADGIRVLRLDGSPARLVVRAALGSFFADAAWLPGSNGLVFIRYVQNRSSTLFRIRDDGSGFRRLTPRGQAGIDPALAPGGRLFAYARVRPAGNRGIAVARADGSHPRTLTRNRYGWDHEPTWSPDGRRIAFVRSLTYTAGALYVVRAAGGNPRLLWAGDRPNHPAWSPDGGQIAVDGIYNSAAPGIRVVDLANGTARDVTHPPTSSYDIAAAWSPDGTRLAFVRRLRSRYTYERIMVTKLATGEEGPISEFVPYGNLRVRWSPDGTRLAAISCLRLDIGYCTFTGVATMRPDGSGQHVIWSRQGFFPSGVSWG